MPDPIVPIADSAGARAVVRHLLATLAYRAEKVLRDVPADFPTRTFGTTTRRPVTIVAPLADLMAWSVPLVTGEHVWRGEATGAWDIEVARFFEHLAELDAGLAANAPLAATYEQLLQGPICDAFTHVGQLAILRGMADVPIAPERYALADIVRGRVGPAQSPPRREFNGDPSDRRPPYGVA